MTTLFLAATGGHLTELDSLASRIPPNGQSVWVTHANEQSRSMLTDRDVEFVPYVGVRNVPDVVRCIPKAHRLMDRWKLTRAVSTGSGIALGFLPYLAARGVECHYIESATRVTGPSLTGKVIQWVPSIRTYTQYPHWAGRNWAGRRWRYGGSVLDGYEAVDAPRSLGDEIRVVVTVGTATEYPFRRLFVQLAPLLAPHGELHRVTGRLTTVLWQTGGTPVDDLPLHPTPFLPSTELTSAIQEADIVITHAGTGSALATLDAGVLPLLVTREYRCGEAGDNHQRQLAAELSRRGLGLHCEVESITVDDLLATLSTSIRPSSTAPPYLLRS